MRARITEMGEGNKAVHIVSQYLPHAMDQDAPIAIELGWDLKRGPCSNGLEPLNW